MSTACREPSAWRAESVWMASLGRGVEQTMWAMASVRCTTDLTPESNPENRVKSPAACRSAGTMAAARSSSPQFHRSAGPFVAVRPGRCLSQLGAETRVQWPNAPDILPRRLAHAGGMRLGLGVLNDVQCLSWSAVVNPQKCGRCVAGLIQGPWRISTAARYQPGLRPRGINRFHIAHSETSMAWPRRGGVLRSGRQRLSAGRSPTKTLPQRFTMALALAPGPLSRQRSDAWQCHGGLLDGKAAASAGHVGAASQ